jgi:L-threonylcarbamoyladenylate synthase
MLIADIKTIESFNCEIPFLVKVLIDRFWPGPLTIILNTKDAKHSHAFRMPKNEIAKRLIEACGSPLAAPSANISGEKPPITCQDVLDDLDGKIDAVLDAGPTRIGVESTIIDATSFPYRVIREGAISKIKIQDVWHLVQE